MNARTGAALLAVAIGVCSAMLAACGETVVPRPRGYLRIDFPRKEYVPCADSLPFAFEMPVYASLLHSPREEYAYNLAMPQYRATIHLTYYHRPGALPTLMEDSRRMAYQHSVRADAIRESVYTDSARRVYALMYRLAGDVASAVQFYATDSTSHFLRGALYFYAVPNADSLAPAVAYFDADIVHLLETLRWKDL